MAFYKVEDKNLLAQVDEFFNERQKFVEGVIKFSKDCGLDYYSHTDHLYFGLEFHYLGELAFNKESIDKSKWIIGRTIKEANPPIIVLKPKKSNKEFHKFYSENVPKETFSYKPLLKLIIKEDYCLFQRGGIGYTYRKGEFLLIEMSEARYTPCDGVVEILSSEYHALKNSEREVVA